MCGDAVASACAQLRCRPLVTTTPVPTLADVVSGKLCEPERSWQDFAHCADRALAAADGREFVMGKRDGAYWEKAGISLCRGVVFQLGTTPAP